MVKRQSDKGFGTIGILLIILVVVGVGFSSWYIWHKHQSKEIKAQSQTSTTTKKPVADPYSGWKVATSPRAGFSIKYPSTWMYSVAVGSKDNVEHITIDSSHLHITIDSYIGKDVTSGGAPSTSCVDCTQTVSSTNFTVPKLGKVKLNTVKYQLDTGEGIALVLVQPDSTYYIPSMSVSNIYTSFRGISILNSEQAYQAESSSQFISNPDYKTAQMIFESLTY